MIEQSGRCRVLAQGGRGERTDPDPVRRGAGHRAQDQADDDKIARRSHGSVAQPDCAQSRQEAAPGPARQNRRRSRRRQHARGSGAKGEAARRRFRRGPFRPRSGRVNSPSTCRTAPTSSAAPSPPTLASTTIRSTSTAAISGTTSPPSPAQPHAQRGQGRGDTALARRRDRFRLRPRRPISSTSSRTATRSPRSLVAKISRSKPRTT